MTVGSLVPSLFCACSVANFMRAERRACTGHRSLLTGHVSSSDPFDDRARAEAAAAAHRDQRIAAIGALDLMQRGGDQARAGAAGRMAERDRAAVGIDALRIRRELLHPGEDDGRERFVDLELVD